MFNIVQIQNRLQNVSKDDLIRYMQNPNPQVPSYLVLTELNRRNQIEKDYVKNNPPKSTVAQDLEQSAKPQGIAMLAKQENPKSEGLAGLSTGDMYKEENFATGGIVAFANNEDQPVSSNMPDNMFVTPQIIPRRAIPTMDDILMEKLAAQQAFGVDPDFYKHAQEKGARETAEDIAETKKANEIAILSELSDKLTNTPGTFLRGLSAAGPSAAKTAVQGMKDIRDIKRMRKAADEKLQMAQYAQARGDADAAQKHIEDYKTINTNIDIEESKLKNASTIASAKATGETNKAEALLKYHAAQIGEQKFVNAYPSGSVSGYLGDNAALTQFIRNRYIKDAEDYLRSGTLKAPPKESDIKKEFEAAYPKLAAPGSKKESKVPAADKPVVTSKPPVSARPPQINNLLNKYPPQPTSGIMVPQKRSTNTPAELELNRRLEYFNQYPPSEGQEEEEEENA